MYYVQCPYCLEDNLIKDYSGEDELELLCDNCNKEFKVYVELEPIFYSKTLEDNFKPLFKD